MIDKRTRDLGGGFEVGRVLPFAKRPGAPHADAATAPYHHGPSSKPSRR